jgi:tRNA pseudouridine55 synthase
MVVRFGSETDSGDLTGRVTTVSDRRPEEAEVREAVRSFLGVSRQEAPAFSALKVGGRPLYWYARRGLEATKADREVVVHRIDVVEKLGPDVTLDVACGRGTYMRVLARDLGRALGCSGHLAALRRMAVGAFRVEDAVPLWRLVEEYGS